MSGPIQVPTQAQLYIALAALARSFTLPSINGNQTGIFGGPGNQLQIPIDESAQGVYNLALGPTLQITADEDYIYIQSNIGDAGLG